MSKRTASNAFLDGLLANVANTHARPAARLGAVRDDAGEVATTIAPRFASGAWCSNCGTNDGFTEDYGDVTCTRCGAVQNSRSIASTEEEYRTFADDEKS